MQTHLQGLITREPDGVATHLDVLPPAVVDRLGHGEAVEHRDLCRRSSWNSVVSTALTADCAGLANSDKDCC